jgi:protein-S-isoprenylcysteine O-methyltransferase Ste14
MSLTRWRWSNVPLPEVHLSFLGAGVLLHLLASWTLFGIAWLGLALGWASILAGVSIAAWAVKAAATVDVRRPTEIVTTGPYALSRNPMYVAWDLIYIGVALVLNATWPLLLLPLVILLNHAVILREERRLEDLFGIAYATYKSSVRRYL